MIELKNLNVGYMKTEVVKDINLILEKGKIYSLLGANGSGKTTILNTIIKFLRPLKGEILIDNININKLSFKELSKIISYVPQFHMPKFDYTVFDIIMTGRAPYISYLPKKNDIEIVAKAITDFKLDYIKEKSYTKLSGGQKQLCLIARAVVQNTPIIILDEPTSALDLKNQKLVLNIIKNLNENMNKTFIMTLHDPSSALVYSDYSILVNNKVIEFGLSKDILTTKNIKKVYNVDSEIINKNGKNYILPLL